MDRAGQKQRKPEISYIFYSIQINNTSKGRPPSRNTWHGSSYFTVARKYRCRAVNFRTGAGGFRSFENLRANDDSTLSHYSTCQLFYMDVHRFIC